MKSRHNQNILAATIIVITFLVLLFQGKIWNWWEEKSLPEDSRPPLAEMSEITNGVRFRLPESLDYHKAKTSMKLHRKDTIATDLDGTAIITFRSGLRVELQPDSLITIEDYNPSIPGSLELTFLKGSVKVLSQGSHGIKLPAEAIAKAPELGVTPQNTLGDLKTKKPIKESTGKKNEGKETLPDSYIASIIRNQRSFLNRCYAQYLKVNPDARGRIDCALTIEPDGNISTARVIGSTISNPGLQQCVVSALQRARFKSFKGDPIVVNYPINFE